MSLVKFRSKAALTAWLVFAPIFGGNAAQTEPMKIRIGWIVTPAELSPIMFAKKGVARHDGVTYAAQSMHFGGSTLEIAALQAGDLDIATFGSNSFPIAVENAGMDDLRIIADELRVVPGWSGPDYSVLKDSPIKMVDDLKGKVLAINVFGGVSDLAIKAMLVKNHLVLNRDASEIEIAFPNMKSVLLEHKADLVTAVHPFDLDPEFTANSRILFTTPDALGPFEISFWTTRTSFIEKHRTELTDLLEDYVRAFHWYLDPANRAEAIQIVSQFTKVPTAAYEKWLFVPNKGYYLDPDATPQIDAVTANIHLEHELGLVKADLDAQKYSDLSMLKTAIERIK